MTDSSENRKYEKGTLGWIKEQQRINAKKDGFTNVEDWKKWKINIDTKKDGFDNVEDWKKWKIGLLDFFKGLEYRYGKDFADWARKNRDKLPDAYLKAGCKNWKEYFDKNAKLAGFKDYNERQKLRSWENGTKEPKDINEECSSYLSNKSEEYFEKYLLNYFENVKRTDKGSWDNGIDIYCSTPKQEFIGKYRLEKENIIFK